MKSSVENKATSLLTRDENEQVFKMFDYKCQSLSTAIVQLFYTQSPDHVHWVKKDTGVMCFIKDNNRRNYFFRMYCLNRCKLIWEQELYVNFEYKCAENYFHMFEIDDCIAGLNFASENEALTMKNVIMEKLAIKRQRREERRSRSSLQNKSAIQPISSPLKSPYNHNSNSNINLTDKYNSPLNNIQNVAQSGRNKKKQPSIRITKDDIGLPVNFVHISHVGWDPNKGFDINVEDPALKKFFNKAGVSDRQLEDKETRDFIYEFIYAHGGVDAAKSEVLDITNAAKSLYPPPPSVQIPPTPPPVPARTPVNRSAPPPPPTKAKAPPQQVRGHPPPRPDPIQSIPEPPSMNYIPPPPLPPPMTGFTLNAPPPPPMANLNNATPSVGVSSVNSLAYIEPDPRSALLESIRAGKNLKPVAEVERKPSVGDSRGDLLSEIRRGLVLKPVQNSQRPSSGPSCPENSMAEALSKALQARAFVIQPDSESDSGNSTDDDDEWDPED